MRERERGEGEIRERERTESREGSMCHVDVTLALNDYFNVV